MSRSGGFSVRFKDRQVQQALRRVAKEIPSAAQQTINRTLPKVRAEAKRRIRKWRNLRASKIGKDLQLRKASLGRGFSGRVFSYTEAVPLEQFKGTKVKRKRGRVKKGEQRRVLGVQVEVIPGQRHILRHAFITQRGHVADQGSDGKKKPRRAYGPSVATAMRKPDVIRALQAKAQTTLPRELDAQLRRRLRKSRL